MRDHSICGAVALLGCRHRIRDGMSRAKREVCVSVDVEANCPILGLFFILGFGMAACGGFEKDE